MQNLLLIGMTAVASVAAQDSQVTLDFAVDRNTKLLHTSKFFSKVQAQSDAPNAAGLNAVLQMGSNKQKVAVLLDTGSDLFWIRKKSCTSCFTSEDFDTGSFDTSASSSYSASSANFVADSLGSYSYGDGTTLIDCELAVDQMDLGALNVPNQTFCAVNQMSSPNVPINDGILGLSIPSAKVGAANIFNINGLKRYFGFWYHTVSGNVYDGGKITLGGDDPNLRFGDLTSIPASTSSGRFTITLTEVSVGGSLLGSGSSSILVDTGTVATLLPSALADAINSKLTPLINDNCGANNKDTITFTFGNSKVTMRLNQLLVQDSGGCYSYVKAGSGLSILGSWFLQSFYTAFDYDSSTISFAKPAVISGFSAPALPNQAQKGMSTILIGGLVLAGILVLAVIIYFLYRQYQKRKSVPPISNNPPQMQQQYQYPQYPTATLQNQYPQQPNEPMQQYPQQPDGTMPQYSQQPTSPMPQFSQQPNNPMPQLHQQSVTPVRFYPLQEHRSTPNLRQDQYQGPLSAQEPHFAQQPQFSNQRPMSDQYPQFATRAAQNQQYSTFLVPGAPQQVQSDPRIVTVDHQI